MTWKYRRVFECEFCGKLGIGEKTRDFFDVSYWTLPPGWIGSTKRRRSCICNECDCKFMKAR